MNKYFVFSSSAITLSWTYLISMTKKNHKKWKFGFLFESYTNPHNICLLAIRKQTKIVFLNASGKAIFH